MLCNECQKNQATVFYKQNINGKVSEVALCSECAKESNLLHNDSFGFMNFNPFGMNDLISNFFGMPHSISQTILQCPTCNLTLDEFNHTGKFGCPDCYDAFSDRIDPMLKNIHGSDRYVGRKPKMDDKPLSKAEKLKMELKKAVEAENYEEAAKLRDQIKEMGDKDE